MTIRMNDVVTPELLAELAVKYTEKSADKSGDYAAIKMVAEIVAAHTATACGVNLLERRPGRAEAVAR